MTTSRAVQEIEQMAPQLAALSRELWEHPEVAFTERYTSRRLMSILREEGFAVDNPVAGLETGFVARWGHGKPCIAILAEFDALPGFSQKTQTTEEPEVPGGAGHACGHNLMGAAHTGAAIAVKRELEARGMEGTVVLYGCPAEEVLTGKVFMARAGLFDGCDCAINFHPDSVNGVDMHVLAGIDISYGYLSGAVFVPLVASFILKRFSPKAGLVSLAVGGIVVTVCFITLGTSSSIPTVAGMVSGLISYVLVNAIDKKNRINSPLDDEELEKQLAEMEAADAQTQEK